jgi:hypothetical protein
MQHKSIIHNKQVIRNLFFYAIFCSYSSNFYCNSLGYFLGPKLSKIKQFVFKILPYFSYLLLISVALN